MSGFALVMQSRDRKEFSGEKGSFQQVHRGRGHPPSQVIYVESENAHEWGGEVEQRGRGIFAEPVLQHRSQVSFSSRPGDFVTRQILFLLMSVTPCCLETRALTEITIIKIRKRLLISVPHSTSLITMHSTKTVLLPFAIITT